MSPAALTITADNESKVYGQSLAFAGTEFTSGGLQNGESVGSVTLTSAGAAGTADVAGSPYAITPSNATGGSFSAKNYATTYDAGSLTVTPATLTAGLTGTVTKNFDGTTLATLTAGNYTLAGVANGDAVALNDPATGTYATAGVGAGIDVSVSGLLLGGPKAGDYSLASASISSGIGAIISPTLTLVPNPGLYPVGVSLPVSAGVTSGFAPGGTLADSSTGSALGSDAITGVANQSPGTLKFDADEVTAQEAGTGWLKSYFGMGDFSMIYESAIIYGGGAGDEAGRYLAYSSSFDPDDGHRRPIGRVKPSGT